MRHSHLHRNKILMVVFIAAGVVGTLAHNSESASLTSTSVTLSNSRISFRGQVDTGNTTGTSQLIIETAGNPSNTTNGMVEGDVLGVGVASSQSFLNYEVADIVSASTFSLKSVLAGLSHTQNFDVIASQSARLAVRFTTASAVNAGSIRVLIPAIASDADSSDGVPDQNGWDLNDITATQITCPTGVANYTFGTPTVAASSVTVGSTEYHSIVCPYTGTGGVGSAFQTGTAILYIGDVSSSLLRMINPAPASGHTAGTADTYSMIVQNLNALNGVVDSTTVKVGVIEAVRVTASVAPQLTFTIAGLSTGTQCNITTDVVTTATTVPLGELSISSFIEAAQNLLVSTNASGGYAVTALANDQLGKDGEVCTGDPTANADCIPDSPGDDAAMSGTVEDDWSNTATKGFGYTLENNDAGVVPFLYSTNTGTCSGGGSDCYRQFADAENSQTPVTIFSNTTVADSQDVDLCYRAIISASQAAGNYENYVTYTATATF